MSTGALYNPHPWERAFHPVWDETVAPPPTSLPIFCCTSAIEVEERGNCEGHTGKSHWGWSASQAKKEREVGLVTLHLSSLYSLGDNSPVYTWGCQLEQHNLEIKHGLLAAVLGRLNECFWSSWHTASWRHNRWTMLSIFGDLWHEDTLLTSQSFALD